MITVQKAQETIEQVGASGIDEVVSWFGGKSAAQVERGLNEIFTDDDNHTLAAAVTEVCRDAAALKESYPQYF